MREQVKALGARAVIDLDIPVYTECASAQSRGNPFGTYSADIDALVASCRQVMDDWKNASGAASIFLAYTSPARTNFRKHILVGEYKSGRVSPKPDGYYEVLDILINQYDSMTIDGIEGDDVCGILHTSKEFGPTVAISTDKDFRTLEGYLFNPMKMVEPELITQNMATDYWMLQTLMGDPTDGYKGCPRIGAVKARRILDEANNGSVIPSDEIMTPSFYEAGVARYVEEAYRDHYGDMGVARDAMVKQARCARILHRCDYSPEGNAIRLWHPTDPEWMDLSKVKF